MSAETAMGSLEAWLDSKIAQAFITKNNQIDLLLQRVALLEQQMANMSNKAPQLPAIVRQSTPPANPPADGPEQKVAPLLAHLGFPVSRRLEVRTVVELKELCDQCGLTKGGNKAEIIATLTKAEIDPIRVALEQ
jgi:hypothetical protein